MSPVPSRQSCCLSRRATPAFCIHLRLYLPTNVRVRLKQVQLQRPPGRRTSRGFGSKPGRAPMSPTHRTATTGDRNPSTPDTATLPRTAGRWNCSNDCVARTAPSIRLNRPRLRVKSPRRERPARWEGANPRRVLTCRRHPLPRQRRQRPARVSRVHRRSSPRSIRRATGSTGRRPGRPSKPTRPSSPRRGWPSRST